MLVFSVRSDITVWIIRYDQTTINYGLLFRNAIIPGNYQILWLLGGSRTR